MMIITTWNTVCKASVYLDEMMGEDFKYFGLYPFPDFQDIIVELHPLDDHPDYLELTFMDRVPIREMPDGGESMLREWIWPWPEGAKNREGIALHKTILNYLSKLFVARKSNEK